VGFFEQEPILKNLKEMKPPGPGGFGVIKKKFSRKQILYLLNISKQFFTSNFCSFE